MNTSNYYPEQLPDNMCITDKITTQYFDTIGKKREGSTTEKLIITLLEKGIHPYTIKKEIENMGEKASLQTINELDKKRHEINRNSGVEQNEWDRLEEEIVKKQIILALTKERGYHTNNTEGAKKHIIIEPVEGNNTGKTLKKTG